MKQSLNGFYWRRYLFLSVETPTGPNPSGWLRRGGVSKPNWLKRHGVPLCAWVRRYLKPFLSLSPTLGLTLGGGTHRKTTILGLQVSMGGDSYSRWGDPVCSFAYAVKKRETLVYHFNKINFYVFRKMFIESTLRDNNIF